MAMEKSRCSSTPSQPALVSEAREWEAKSGSNNNHSPRARPEMAGTAIIVTLRKLPSQISSKLAEGSFAPRCPFRTSMNLQLVLLKIELNGARE